MNERTVFHVLIAGGLMTAAAVFLMLFFVVAPYGRHVRQGWGPTVNNVLGWVVMETPAAWVLPLCLLFGSRPLSRVTLVFAVMWECHYLYRTYIFPFRIRNRSRKMPVVIMVSAICFNLFNGYLNGRYLGHFAPPYPAGWLLDPRFLLGAILFTGGLATHIQADHVLFRLRKPGETQYKIPSGGLYRWVSCPNYFGEIIEWTGWAIATWSLPGLVFAVWTVANLVPRARAHHRWYLERFADYPRSRRAVIPFLY